MFSFCWEIDKKKQITEENLPIYLNTNKLCMFSAFIFINASCSWIWLLIEMSSVTWNSNDARQMEWRQNHRHHYQLLVLNWQRDTDRHHERDTWKWAYVCMQQRCWCIGIGEIESHHTLLHHQTPWERIWINSLSFINARVHLNFHFCTVNVGFNSWNVELNNRLNEMDCIEKCFWLILIML